MARAAFRTGPRTQGKQVAAALKHFSSARFWALYNELPEATRAIADKNFQLLKSDPKHPSLHFKRVGKLWSVRVGEHHRALARDVPEGVKWFGLVLMLNMTESPANNEFEQTQLPMLALHARLARRSIGR